MAWESLRAVPRPEERRTGAQAAAEIYAGRPNGALDLWGGGGSYRPGDKNEDRLGRWSCEEPFQAAKPQVGLSAPWVAWPR